MLLESLTHTVAVGVLPNGLPVRGLDPEVKAQVDTIDRDALATEVENLILMAASCIGAHYLRRCVFAHYDWAFLPHGSYNLHAVTGLPW